MSDLRAPSDSGLLALAMLLRIHGVAIDPDQLRHRLGRGLAADAPEMLRCAKELGFKARSVTSEWKRLVKTPLPALAEQPDGTFVLLAKAADDKVLIYDAVTNQPAVLSRDELQARWTGRLLLFTRRAELSDLARRFDIGWFMQAMHKYRGLLAEVLVASLFLQVFALISPLFFQVVIDKVLVHRGITTLDVLVLGLVTVSIFEAVLGAMRTYVFSHTTNRIDVELGARLFRHLLALPLAYFEARRVGDSVARVRELESIRNFLTGSALTLVVDLAFTVVFIAVMLYYSPILTAVTVSAFPLYIALSAGLTPLFRRRLDEKFRRGAENQSFLVESVTGIETLKAMAVEPEMQRRWEEQLAAYVTASFRVSNLANVGSQSIQVLSKLTTAAILYLGARLAIEGSLTVGELVAFNMLASRVASPVLRLAQIWQDFHQAKLSIDRLGDILNTQPEPAYDPAHASPPNIRGDVTFEHVGFRYRPDGPEILRGISLQIKAGEIIGIVGPSGSGKSTIAKLLQRLYVPEQGRVLVDGVDLALVDAAWLRRQVGVVLQDNILFNRSIRDNIALADPAMPMEKVMEAAQLAGAHEFILELPKGYDTPVGERGTLLSGGQRQRVAIARALATNPRLLIFDEATSALDYESERVIHNNMRRICDGRTVFIIAHRLSTVRQADRIISIDRGRIVEDGPHEELLHGGGPYATLLRAQMSLHEAV